MLEILVFETVSSFLKYKKKHFRKKCELFKLRAKNFHLPK